MSSPYPAPITISPKRIDQLHSTVQTFINGFQVAVDDDFSNIYAPTIRWFDHAFLIQRVGHKAVMGLQKAFTHCNQPFHADVKAIIPTEKGCVLEQVWVGRCANDIVRPNGEIAVKASGKDFKCHVCMVMEIDEEGKISRIDEYYTKRWDDGIGEEEYVVMKGESLKE